MSTLKQANTILEVFQILNEHAVKLLKAGVWDLTTCADSEPNVVLIAFKGVIEDGKLIVGDVVLETTPKNIQANSGRMSSSVYDARNLEDCQIKGTAIRVTSSKMVDTFKAKVEKIFNGAATARERRLSSRKKELSLLRVLRIRKFCESFGHRCRKDHIRVRIL